MAKNEKVDKIIGEVEEAEKVLRRKKRELATSCGHKKKSGKLNLRPSEDEPGKYVCKKCHKEFSLERISKKEAVHAAEVIDSMIQQIKCFSSDDEIDDKILRELGNMSCGLETVLDMYNKCLKSVGKKEKKKNKDKFGNYGFQGMSFLKK